MTSSASAGTLSLQTDWNPGMTPQAATPEANIELLRDTLEAFNIGDIETCMTRLAPDFVINLAELPEPLYGRETWRQGVEVMRAGFPDIRAHIEDVVAAHDKVALRMRFHGTHSGEFLGFPATGRTIEYISHEFYRIADSLIAEEWICSDMATLFRQIS